MPKLAWIYAGLLISLTGGSITTLAASDPAVSRGLEIATEHKKRDTGWGDSESQVLMVLRNAQGRESTRRMRTMALEVQGDGDRALTVFDEPGDVRGSAFLTHTHTLVEDDQWLYLPSVRRTRRIATRNKSGPFMASEFAYEDMASFELEKFSFRYLRDEEANGQLSYVVEQIPTDTFSGYSRLIAWYDQQHYRLLQVEYYDRRNSLLKTLALHDYQLFLEQYWRPMKLSMLNHQTGKSTDLIIESMRFRTGRTESDFDVNALDRAR